MSVMNHIPTIFYNNIPNLLDMMEPSPNINQIKANIKEYGENIYRNSNFPLECFEDI